MTDLLDWIFTSGWRFAGVVMLLIIVFDGLTHIAQAIRGRR